MTSSTSKPPRLTLADLVETLSLLLSEGYRGSGSGRIRDLPDARTVRWYQTTGLVDRPVEYRGRTALFGRRHLLQVAAIKTLQSSGFPLAEIQQGIAGKTDVELSRAAGISVKAADDTIAEVLKRNAVADGDRMRAAVSGTPPAQGEDSASRRKNCFWAGDASGHGATDERTVPEPQPGLPLPPLPQTQLQSLPLSSQAMVVWQGRPLTDAEQQRFYQLAGPLAEFLREREPSALVSKKTQAARSARGVQK